MKYVLKLRARPEECATIEDKHSRLIEGLVALGGDWGLPPGEYPAPDAGEELSAQFQLGKLLGKGITGFVNYRFRGGLRDESGNDDYIDLEFNPDRIDYHHLLNEVIPYYIDCFRPYHAYAGDEEFTYIDFGRSRGFDHRSGVLRVHPANFFDEQLCKRAFCLSPEEVQQRLTGIVQRAEVIQNGVNFIAQAEPMQIENAESLNDQLRSALAAG